MSQAKPAAQAKRTSGPSRIALSDSVFASARCVQGVMAGQSLSDCLAATDAALRPSVQAISFHVMRRLGFAQAVRSKLVARPPADTLLDSLLLVALTLLDTAIQAAENPDSAPSHLPVYAVHTVVDQSVNAVQRKLKPYRGLVNGTLRNFIRQRAALLSMLDDDDVATWNYPRWWIDAVKVAWPEQWRDVLDAGNRPGPMTLRVNPRRASLPQVLDAFSDEGIETKSLQDHAIALPQPQPVQALPGFTQGWWSVQDLAAQRAGTLLSLQSGMRVLDACAAPGGKTAHLLEQSDIELLALDSDPARLERVAENLDRLGLDGPHVTLRCADASDLDAWWDGQPFDAVLADVPCTASGVVRRHPDIRWLRRKSDIKRTSALQRKIIDALWQTVRPGGQLLYVTCSIFPEEGEQQAVAFCERQRDARRLSAPGQVLPLPKADGLDAGDGFFYALFTKLDAGQPSP